MAKGFWNQLGEIDFAGQRLSDNIYKYLILFTAVVCFTITCITKQFMYTGYGVAAATILSIVLVTPPWPFYKRNEIEWATDEKKKK